ncbi:MAG: hypothetical protein ACI4AK_03230 [Lepagella sp.]
MMRVKTKYYWWGGCIAVLIAFLAWGGIYISRSHSYSDEEIAELFARGLQAVEKDDVVTAFSLLQKVITATSDGRDDNTHFEASVYLALIYSDMGELQEAYSLLKSLKYRESNRPELYASQYYLRLMGYLSLKLDKDVKASTQYINRVIELEKRLYPDHPSFIYMDLANLCELYYLNREYDKAEQLIHELENKEHPKNIFYLSQVYYAHGLLMLHKAKPDSARYYALKGREISKKYKNSSNESQNLIIACKADSLAGLLAPYIADRHNLDSINRNMKGGEVARQIAVIREQNKMALLQRESELDHAINMIVMAFMIMVIIMLTLLFYSFRKRALDRQRLTLLEKNELNSAIEKERLEKELLQLKQANTAIELEKEKDEKLSMSIKLVEHGEGDEVKDSLSALDAALNAQHADFLRRVSRAYPRISDTDVRLLGFIRMGLSPAVIAKALNVTTGSVNTSRYRLRKKLGLDSSVDLNSFAQNF